jgi:predicted DNA-binding protein YlxM (UPF0122 family)
MFVSVHLCQKNVISVLPIDKRKVRALNEIYEDRPVTVKTIHQSVKRLMQHLLNYQALSLFNVW